MKRLLTKHFLLLSLIVSGAAVSVSAEPGYRRDSKQGEVRINVATGFFYDSEKIGFPSKSSVLQGEGRIAAGIAVIDGLELSLTLPFHADVIDSFSTAGIGDLLFNVRWRPLNERPVRPVLSLHSVIPTGSDNRGGTPRYLNLWEIDNSSYSSDEVILSPEVGAVLQLRDVVLPSTFAIATAPQISFQNSEHIALNSMVWVELFSNSMVSPSLGFEMKNPLNDGSKTAFSNGSYSLQPMVTVKRANVDLGFKSFIGLGDAAVLKNGTRFKVDSDFGFEVSCNFYIGKRKQEKADDTVRNEEIKSVEESSASEIVFAVDTADVEHGKVDSSAFDIAKDSDSDGILDEDDKCPEAKELYNGIDDLDGCPDFDKEKRASEVVTSILWGVEFASGSTSLSYDSKKALAPLLTMMKKSRSKKIELRGYSDHSGGYETNIRISQKRAESVMSYLVQNGIPEERIVAVGYGANYPYADNRTSKGRKLNRRIEYFVIEN